VQTEPSKIVMDEAAVHRAIARMARELVERNAGAEGLILVGIHRRGVELADLLGSSDIPADIDGRNVVIVDDVCYTGRTARAAMDHLADFGRPARIYLCVLVDRGGRELPIQPDFVGRHFEVTPAEDVAVLVPQQDGRLAVELRKMEQR
jgi:pyrimidine operon attenuation protein/uracil phosphoribosyltransferase